MYEIAAALKIRRIDFADDLEEMESFTLIAQFMMAKWDFQIWEKGVTGFGLKQLEAFKLFDVLCKVCDDFGKSEAAHTTPTV